MQYALSVGTCGRLNLAAETKEEYLCALLPGLWEQVSAHVQPETVTTRSPFLTQHTFSLPLLSLQWKGEELRSSRSLLVSSRLFCKSLSLAS